MNKLATSTLLIIAALAMSGCATTMKATSPEARTTRSVPPEVDRQAILQMAGEYVVTFAFDETVALEPGYERKASKRSGASEVVIVIEESAERIVLQHLLLVGNGDVIKHWRQDWTWQADQRLEFVDDQTWRRVTLDPEITRGAWTQCVYEVSDAPRYCGTGRWNHRYGNATWTSDRSWRPLPRREYTSRDDYNALNVENRHTITPDGWTHEQDNSKVVRVDGETRAVLVREFGFNNYHRIDTIDFTPAYIYWEETAEYWADVRQTWKEHFDTGGVVLATGVDGMPIIEGLFELAEQSRSADLSSQTAIDEVFSAYVRPMTPIISGQLAGNRQ